MSADNLVSMKRTKKEKKRGTSDQAIDSSHDDFPYGLTLSLDDESLDKLGMTKLPKVGAEMIVVGIGTVESVNERSSASRKSRDVRIQLTKLEVEPLKADSKEIKTAEDAVSAGIKEA